MEHLVLREKNLILRFQLVSGGIANGSLKLTIRGTPVACVDDIKDINLSASLAESNEQPSGRTN